MNAIRISGARIYYTIPIFGGIPITQTQVNSLLVMGAITVLCLVLTRDMALRARSKRQIAAEWIVEKTEALVKSNMGKAFEGFAPLITALLSLSALSSLTSLLGLYPPTADLNTVAGWAIPVFLMVTYYKIKSGGVRGYLRGLGSPHPLFAPFNVLSEVGLPVSMAFRHFGNVVSGVVILSLVNAALAAVSGALFGGLPGVLGRWPLLQIGIPALLSVYFDLFSGCMQAFIFAMLTMLYISAAAGEKTE